MDRNDKVKLKGVLQPYILMQISADYGITDLFELIKKYSSMTPESFKEIVLKVIATIYDDYTDYPNDEWKNYAILTLNPEV